MECPEAVNAISNGDVVSVDADAGTITDETTGETFTASLPAVPHGDHQRGRPRAPLAEEARKGRVA